MTQKVAHKEWMDQVAAEHRELGEHKQRIRSFLEQPRPEIGNTGSHTWASELSRQLVDFHDLLYRHFRFEEEGGMIEELVRAHPRADRRGEALVTEHQTLLAESRTLLADAAAYADGVRPSDPGLRQRIVALFESLSEHEMTENQLIFDLEFDDLGQGD